MKRILALLLTIMLLFTLVACNSGTATKTPASTPNNSGSVEQSGTPNSGEKLKIGYYGIGPITGFFKAVYEEIESECAAKGYEFIGVVTDYNPVKMRSAYDQFKLQDVDIIIDGNAVYDIVFPFAEQAQNEGQPYLSLFMELPEPYYSFGASNADMGQATGEFIGNIIKDEWNGEFDGVILIGGFTMSPDIVVRLTSAVDAMGKIVDVGDKPVIKLDPASVEASYQAMMDTLTANPNMRFAVFCQTDEMAINAFAAAEAAGRAQDCVGTGVDCVDAAKEYWKEAVDSGNMTAPWRGSVYLASETYGQQIVELAEKIFRSEDAPYYYAPPVYIAGTHNLYEIFPELK